MKTKSEKLKGKRIIYAITGSIACSEAIKIARELRRHGASIIPVMSKEASNIITTKAFEFASGNEVITSLSGKAEHLIKADLMLIAPCTANTLAKIANGIADNAVTTFALANKKILVALAMDEKMYGNEVVQYNIEKCKKRGISFIEPKMEEGKAKMADMEVIIEAVLRAVRKSIDKKLLIIGGNTMEAIDDVRAITNFSSGKMALALAREAYERVESVEVWLGNIECPSYIKNCKNFGSLDDLIKLIENAGEYDAIINCAAISDFIVEKRKGKIESGKELTLKLIPAPRINKMLRSHTKKLIIFKLDEEKNLMEKARKRKKEDKADYVIANPIENIGKDEGKAYVMGRKVKKIEGSKEKIAKHVIDLI